jgi:hypothetical protein
MKKLALATLLALLVGCATGPDPSVAGSPARATLPRLVETRLSPLLMDLLAFPFEYRESAKKVAEMLRSEKEDPSEFRVHLFESEDGTFLRFHLRHTSAPEDRDRRMFGNPGGKGRTIDVDLKQGTVSKSMFWQ